jgi:hypothetical protein
MPWPSMAAVVDRLVGAPSGETNEVEEAGETTDPVGEQPDPSKDPAGQAATSGTDAARTQEPTTQTQEQPKPTPPATTQQTQANTLADQIREQLRAKGAGALVKELPDDVVQAIGPQLYPGMQRALDRRDKATRRELDTIKAELRDENQKLQDDLITRTLGEDEAKAYRDRRDLERLRQAESAVREAPAIDESAVLEWWRVALDAGLPADEKDPRVRAIWDATYDISDFEQVKTKIRELAKAGPGTSAKAAQPALDPAELAKMVDELAEKKANERLKKIGLTVDTGKPAGAGAGEARKPKTLAEASAMAIERIKAGRG